jgi:hypothetical protein
LSLIFWQIGVGLIYPQPSGAASKSILRAIFSVVLRRTKLIRDLPVLKFNYGFIYP